MRCHVCGSEMQAIVTSLPFKLNEMSIVIIKDLPVSQCSGCNEYMMEDHVLKHLEKIFDNVNEQAEIEIIKYAAAA
jgi:YgiT-type zinc finger domain-containing protein